MTGLVKLVHAKPFIAVQGGLGREAEGTPQGRLRGGFDRDGSEPKCIGGVGGFGLFAVCFRHGFRWVAFLLRKRRVKFGVVRVCHAERSRLPCKHSRKEDRKGDRRCCRVLRDLSACTIRPTLAKLGNLLEKPLLKGPFPRHHDDHLDPAAHGPKIYL